MSSVIYYLTDARQHRIYLFYILKKQTTTDKPFNLTRKPTSVAPRSAHFDKHEKAIWRNLLSIQMKQSHCLLYVAQEFWLFQENHATVKLDSSVASHGMKTYSESRIELRNLKKHKESARKKETALSSPVSWKAWILPWLLQELKRFARKIGVCGQHWRSFNRPFSKMAAENSHRSILKTYKSIRKNTFTLATLPSFSISGVISP